MRQGSRTPGRGRGGRGEGRVPPAYTGPDRNPLEDPAIRAQFRRFVRGEIENITGRTPWNNNRRGIQIPRLRLDREEIKERLPQGPGAPIIRAIPDAEHRAILIKGLAATRRFILISFFTLVAINIILDILLHHLVYI